MDAAQRDDGPASVGARGAAAPPVAASFALTAALYLLLTSTVAADPAGIFRPRSSFVFAEFLPGAARSRSPPQAPWKASTCGLFFPIRLFAG